MKKFFEKNPDFLCIMGVVSDFIIDLDLCHNRLRQQFYEGRYGKSD